jgi:hypothetical protein
MNSQDYTQKQRDQIHHLQNAVWDLDRARDHLVDAGCSTSVLQALDTALDKAQQELNDVSTLM